MVSDARASFSSKVEYRAVIRYMAERRYYVGLNPRETRVYYANLPDQLKTAIREKRQGKLFKGVLLQQDKARVHTGKVAMDAVERNGYELILHPAYSPDLLPTSQT